MRIRTCLAFCAILLLLSPASGLAAPQEAKQAAAPQQSAPADARTADRLAIRQAIDAFAKTFEARDAKTLAGHFTAEGEYQNVQGTKLRGREALERAFAEFFAKTPEVTARVEPEALRFLSTDSAIDEGVVTVQRGPTNPAARARYSALVVREAGVWQLAHLSESPAETQPSIAGLGWLVGQWKSAGDAGVEMQTNYAWDPGKKFIYMRFTRRDANLALSGTQIIGLDPATGMIHSWTFETTGGIGEADWHRDDDHWVLDAAGTLADGRTLAETNVLRRVNDDTFTWQSINRMLDGVELPDLPPTKITRIKTGQ